MLVDLANSHRPSLHRVTLLAIGPELTLVNVGVAVRASLAHVGENGLQVTLCAGHLLVQAAQWELGLTVIEFGDGANRFPSSRRVAVLAGRA